MKSKPLTHSLELHIWIAENGDTKARALLCKEALMNTSTLCRILKGNMPRFETRYRIYKITGIKLNEEDNFPEMKAQSAS